MNTDRDRIGGEGRNPEATTGLPAAGRVALIGALLLATLAACGTTTPSQAQRSASSTGSVAAVPTSSSPSPASAASTPRTSIEAADPSADVTPASIDIVRIRVELAQDRIALTMTLAAVIPTDPLAGLLAYRFYLDTDGDATWDHMAALEAAPNGDFVPVLVDRLPGRKREGAQYPGTADVSDQVVAMTVPLADIGCPVRIAVRASAEHTEAGLTSRDEVPAAATEWLRVETGCPVR